MERDVFVEVEALMEVTDLHMEANQVQTLVYAGGGEDNGEAGTKKGGGGAGAGPNDDGSGGGSTPKACNKSA